MLIFLISRLCILLVTAAIGTLYLKVRDMYPLTEFHPVVSSRLISAAAMSLVLFGGLVFGFHVAGHDNPLLAFSIAIAFFLPTLTRVAWMQFSAIPLRDAAAWYSPEQSPQIGQKAAAKKTAITLRVVTSADEADEVMQSLLPANLSLGQAFTNYMMGHAAMTPIPVQMFDEDRRPYGWHFYTTRFFGLIKRPLVAKKSISGLALRDGALVEAFRCEPRPRPMFRTTTKTIALTQTKP